MNKDKKNPEDQVGVWIGVGIAIGAGVGVALGNIALGIAIGVAMGTAMAYGQAFLSSLAPALCAFHRRQKTHWPTTSALSCIQFVTVASFT